MVKIDAMFFSATEEPCNLVGQRNKNINTDIENESRTAAHTAVQRDDKYLDYDTFILCNPNAMSY
jgi:hypothetical protein